MTRNSVLYGSAAVALALAVQGASIDMAMAQDLSDGDFVIEEIIVTARKREENIQAAPLSIAAFTSDMIEASNIKTLDDVAKFTAGFSFDEDFQRSGQNRPVIRGQSTIQGASGVSTFIDGVLIEGTILDYDLNDVERVEIIKGPQSALYGRNTYSGAISIVTKSPTDEVSATVKVEAAEFDQYDISASIRGPLSDTLSASLSGRYFDRGGPFLNTYDNTKVGQQESKSLSGVLYFKPNPQLDIRLRARWSELNDDQARLFTTNPEDNNCFFDDGLTYNGNGRYLCGEITEREISIDDVRLIGEKGSDTNTSWQTSLRVDYDISDEWSLTWINGYNHTGSSRKGDFGFSDESLNPFALHITDIPFFFPVYSPAGVLNGPVIDFAKSLEGSNRDYSSELRLAYEGDGWDVLVGGYFYNGRTTTNSNREAPADFANILAEAYYGEISRMVDICSAKFNPVGFNCAAPFYNFALNAELPGATAADFFGGNSLGLTYLTLEADQGTVIAERENLAAFAQVSRDLSDRLTVSAEARVTREKVTSIITERTATYDFLGNLEGIETSPTVSRSEPSTVVNPRFTARYAASNSSNLYAVAARGNKPGGFNSVALAPLGLDEYQDESAWSYEVGAKNTLMNGRMVINAAAFHNTINGYQLSQSVVVPTTDGSPPNETDTAIANIGKVRLKGIELEMVFAPTSIPGLVFNASYALTDSDILQGTDINEGKLNDVLDDGFLNCSLGTADPAVPDCETSGDNTLPGSIVGRQLPRQATHMFNIGVNYTQALTDTWSIVLNSNVSHESKKFVQVHNLAWVGDVTLLNASIGFETDSLRLVFWGKNLTKEDSVVGASRFADEGAGFQRIFMGNPRIGRSFGGSISKSF